MSIGIQAAGDNELEEIVALVNSAYRGDSSKAGWTTEADLLGGQRTDAQTLRSQLSGQGTILCLRREADGPIQACVFLEQKHGGDCYLGMLTVSPAAQRGRLGRQLLEYSEMFARDRGASRMVMTVISVRESLIAWYERRGYVQTGETRPFPYGDRRFGEPKVEGLSFVVLEKQL